MAGEVAEGWFRLTVRARGRPPYVAVCRGTIAPHDGGSVVDVRFGIDWYSRALIVIGISGVCLAIVLFARWLLVSRHSEPFPSVAIVPALLALWIAIGIPQRYRDESARIESAIRDAAGVAMWPR